MNHNEEVYINAIAARDIWRGGRLIAAQGQFVQVEIHCLKNTPLHILAKNDNGSVLFSVRFEEIEMVKIPQWVFE